MFFETNGVRAMTICPYSPELNLIEIVWRFMKYYWLPISAYASFQSLVAAVEDILNRFGTDYRITFQTS